MEREKAEIPLQIQKFDKVHNITIDSMVITEYASPYAGYLVTTWDYDLREELSTQEWAENGYGDSFKYTRKTDTVYVKISNIVQKYNGNISWNSNWESTYISIISPSLQ